MKPYLLAIFSVLCWSLNVVVATILGDNLTPWQIAFIRWFISSLIILPLTFQLLLKYKDLIFEYKKYLILTSFVGITLSNTCVYYAAQTVHPVTLSLIGATGPIFLIIFSWLLANIKITKIQFLGLFITLLGVFTIVAHGRISSMGNMSLKSGDFWMLGTAISFGLYSYYVAQKPKELPLKVFLSVSICLGALFCLPMFILSTIQSPLILGENLNLKVILIMLYMGIFNSFLAYIAWNKALNMVGSFRIGMIYYLMPVFSTIEAALILNETIQPVQFLGGSIILLGILLSNRAKEHISIKHK